MGYFLIYAYVHRYIYASCDILLLSFVSFFEHYITLFKKNSAIE
jgi:hypothetical protein